MAAALPGRAPHTVSGRGATSDSVGYSAAVRPLLSILVVLGVGSLALTAGAVSAGPTRLNVDEECSYKLLSGEGVVLTTSLTFRNAQGGRSASVRVRPGWNVGRMYPKAETDVVVRLGPGQSARRTASRTIPSAPRLWERLRAGGVRCASKFTYQIP